MNDAIDGRGRMSGHSRRFDRRGRVGPVMVTFIALIGVAAIALIGLYFKWVAEPTADNTEQNQKILMQMVGLHEPTTNRLDPRFTDADSDLVADPPADPAKQLDPEKIIFCYVAGEEPETTRDHWKPFVEHLSKITGKPVEYVIFANTKEQLLAMKDGKLHVAGLNTGNVPLAVNQCGFVPVCVLPANDGTGMSRMRLIVPAGSAIASPADLKGHELTLTTPGSNSGYKAALVLLRSDFGLLPARDFTIRYSLGHDESIAGIAGKRFEVAAVSDDMLNRALTSGAVKKEQYKSIYESEKFPTAGLGYAYNLNPGLAAKIREALMSFDWKDTPLAKDLDPAGGTKFIATNYKNDFAEIRRIDDASGQDERVEASSVAAATGEAQVAPASTTQPTTQSQGVGGT